MATRARPGFGMKLLRDPGDGNFVQVPEIYDVSGPGMQHEIVDATNNDSPNGFPERVATGLKDMDDITLQMNWIDDPNQNAMIADCRAGTLRNYRLVYPGGTRRLAGAAFVRKVGETRPMKGLQMADVALATSGEWFRENHP